MRIAALGRQHLTIARLGRVELTSLGLQIGLSQTHIDAVRVLSLHLGQQLLSLAGLPLGLQVAGLLQGCPELHTLEGAFPACTAGLASRAGQ